MHAMLSSVHGFGKSLSNVLLTCGALMLAACGEKPQQPPVPETQPAQLFQSEREALEKAKAVEKTVEKPNDDLRQQVEAQSD